MAFAFRDGVRLHWTVAGNVQKPALVLLNSIGTDVHLWDAVLPHLLMHFRVLRTDTRGHGGSDAPPGDYSLAMLSDDMVAVMAAAGIDRAALAGVSLGGMVAMQLALDHPDHVASLILICTSGAMDAAAWDARIATVRESGTAAIAEMAVGRFLSAPFREQHSGMTRRLEQAIMAQADAGYAGAGAAIRDMALSERLPAITAATLVITGVSDISTPFIGHGDRLVAAIRGARHVALAAAHLPPIEAPEELADAIIGFAS